jgi:hypothetical protein
VENRQTSHKISHKHHSLKIEMGRYRNIPKEQRLCDNCIGIDNEHYKISERKQADKRITTCTLVLLKLRLELGPIDVDLFSQFH